MKTHQNINYPRRKVETFGPNTFLLGLKNIPELGTEDFKLKLKDVLIEKAESVQSLTSAHLKESAEKFQKTESFHCYNRFQIAGYVQKMFDDFENDGQ